MSGLYEELCNLFIKPARQSYSDHDLGPISFGEYGIRQNFCFTSNKGHQIKASFFKVKNKNHNTCIIYLHSFNGSRLQSLRYAPQIMQKGFNFCSFDFSGCGNSAGEYVSLGCNERLDVLRLIDTLKRRYGVTEYFLWGRSMGAATAIKFNSLLLQQQKKSRYLDIMILGIILDSAFVSLKRMAIQVGTKRVLVPQILIKAVFLMVSSSIQQRGGFKFQDLQLQQQVQQIRCSVLLVTSKQDTFVSYVNSQEIFNRLKISNKEIQYTRGEHYQSRDVKIINNIYTFFQKNLKRYNIFKLNCLNNSNSKNQHFHRYHELSPQKQSKSLKRYIDKQQRNGLTSSTKVLFYSAAGKAQSNKRSNQLSLFGLHKNMPSNSIQYIIEKNVHVEQKVQQPKIKFLTISKQAKLKNIQEEIPNNQVSQKTREQSEHQESHRNIIGEKLRKKGKNQRQKFINFKDRNQQTQKHINKIKFQQQKKYPKINFTISNTISPTNLNQLSKSPKRISMTAQQYKNNQINILKGTGFRLNIQDKTIRTQLKIQQPDLKFSGKNKSMTNLIILGGKEENKKDKK